MTYEIYRYIFLGGAILTGVMLVVSVVVFFLLKIPTVIGDLTGANARRAIEDIRSQNERSGDKTYRSSPVNRERGKLTDKISPSGRIVKRTDDPSYGAMGTQKLGGSGQTEETVTLTEVLSDTAETTVLSGGAETAVLSQESQGDETTVLSAPEAPGGFVIESEITYVHTDEGIV